MAHVPTDVRDAFGSNLLSAAETAQHSIMAATRSDRVSLFRTWVDFTCSLGHEPFLQEVPPHCHLNFLIVFACRYQRGLISRSAKPVRSKRVEEALCAMGQEFARLGLQDPWMEGPNYVFRLKTLYKAWDDKDC